VPARRWLGERPWRIDGGAFSVEVKGTRFDVSWDPRSDRFSLDLFEGTVSVEGCGRETAVQVVAGQGARLLLRAAAVLGPVSPPPGVRAHAARS
jgi:ferric-dicitrate binding protein FerR (iron transport regulator)